VTTFVTPPFSSYISGQSTYSRTAAELLTLFAGSPYFPGGKSEFAAPKNEFLEFEEGPSVDVTLEWAKYVDASDQKGARPVRTGALENALAAPAAEAEHRVVRAPTQ
jgi:hypothetical protein